MKTEDNASFSIWTEFRTRLKDPVMRRVLPFYWLLTLALIVVYGFAFETNPSLLLWHKLIPFTLMMVLHLALHWFSIAAVGDVRWVAIYAVVQNVLAMAIVQYAGIYTMVFGLYMPLFGETIGLMHKWSHRALVGLGALVFAAGNILILQGGEMMWSWLMVALPLTAFVIFYVMMYSREAEGRIRSQELAEELQEANRQLIESARQIEVLTLNAERQRMARELHDTLAQGLAGLILQLEAADSHLGSSRPERAQAIIQQAMERARSTLADARKVISDLRSGPATGADLLRDTRAEVERFQHATGITCEIHLCPAADLNARTDVIENAYRMVCEGLANVARHARASKVSVEIKCSQDWLEIIVADDGQGFDPAREVGRSGHYGLVGMRERARMAGGELNIESGTDGTRLHVHLPIKPAGNEG